MTATELERRLADLLRRDADEAMGEPRTSARHEDLMRELGRRRNRHGLVPHDSWAHDARARDSRERDSLRPGRRGWVAVVAAAAVAALVVSVPALLPRPTAPPDATAPVPEASALRVARDFVDAFGSFDRELAASYLADDAELHLWATRTGEDQWSKGNEWFEAIGGRVILLSCQLTGTSRLGTLVECAFDWHTLHSAQLGYDPYVGGLFMFTVADDEIVWARQSAASDDWDVQMWQPFAEWVARNHPRQAAVMYADWPEQNWESLTPRSIRLWGELSEEWAREQ